MLNVNVDDFRKNIDELLEEVIKHDEQIEVLTKCGNVVVLPEEKYNNWIETLNVSSNTK